MFSRGSRFVVGSLRSRALLNSSSLVCVRPRALRGITANSETPSWKIWNVRESEPHPSFAARACIFWLYAFALCSISRVVGRLRGNFLLVESNIPTTRTAGGLHYLSRSAALHGFLYGAALCRLFRWIFDRLFGAVFFRCVADLNRNRQSMPVVN